MLSWFRRSVSNKALLAIVFAAVLAGFASPARAAAPALLADINLVPASGSPSELTAVNGMLFFSGVNTAGTEPWKYNPTPGTAAPVADMVPGPSSSFPASFCEAAGDLFLIVSHDLYRFNTTAGTMTRIVVNPSFDASIDEVRSIGGILYFDADDGTFGSEPWKYDPVTQTLTRLGDTKTGGSSGEPYGFTGYGGKVYFASEDSSSNSQLFEYNPATSTLTQISNAGGRMSLSFIEEIAGSGGKIFVSAETASAGKEVFVYNPADSTLVLAADIAANSSNSSPHNLLEFDSKLYFVAGKFVSGKYEEELYRITPATNALEQATNLNTALATATFGYGPAGMVSFNSKLYFCASDQADSLGRELFAFSSAGDTLTKVDINPTGESVPSQLTPIGGLLYFAASDGTTGEEPYKIDPAGNTFTRLSDIATGAGSSSPTEFVSLGTFVYFSSSGPSGRELYRYNTGNGQTTLAADVDPATLDSHVGFAQRQGFVRLGNKFYFSARDGVSSQHLYALDSFHLTVTPAGISNLGEFPLTPTALTRVGDDLIFSANTSASGTELWKVSLDNPQPQKFELLPGNTSSGPVGSTLATPPRFPVANGKAFIAADLPSVGREIAVYDSAANTAGLAVDVRTGPLSSSPFMKAAFGNYVFFSADVGAGRNLYVLDAATMIPTQLIAADSANPLVDSTTEFMQLGSFVYFNAVRSGIGKELFKFNMTTGAVSLVADQVPGAGDGTFERMAVVGGMLLFSGNFSANAADFTEIGQYNPATNTVTKLTSNMLPGTAFAVAGDRYYFQNTNASEGVELYSVKPGVVGALKAPEIFPGVGSSLAFPVSMAGFDSCLVFSGDDGAAAARPSDGKAEPEVGAGVGIEPYIVNPFKNTVTLLADINPGGYPSSPVDLVALNNLLILFANDGTHGLEPYLLKLPLEAAARDWQKFE